MKFFFCQVSVRIKSNIFTHFSAKSIPCPMRKAKRSAINAQAKKWNTALRPIELRRFQV